MLPSPVGSFRALQRFPKLFLAAILVTGCGGGGGGGSGSDPAQSSFTAGPITGFGSVIVNGIRFDVSGANVADDEDEVQGEGNLKLGMVAEIGSQVEVRAPCLQTEAGSLRQPLNLSTDRTRQFSRCAGSTHAPRMRRCMTMHCTGVS